MNHTRNPAWAISLSLVAFACGKASEVEDTRAKSAFATNAGHPVEVSWELPGLDAFADDSEEQLRRIETYAYRLQGSGPLCPVADELHMDQGPFEEHKLVTVTLNSLCSYSLTLQLGSNKAPDLDHVQAVSFDSPIQNLLATHCSECHNSFTNYADAKLNGSSIVAAITDGQMPPKTPLNETTQAIFLAWSGSGFPEKSKQDTEGGLAQVYFENKAKDQLYDYEFAGRKSMKILRNFRRLGLGQDLGFKSSQVEVLGEKRAKGKKGGK